MTHSLILLIINAFVIIGFYQASGDGQALSWVRKLPVFKWMKKPLYDCIGCMASFHSVYFYWISHPWNYESLLYYPVYILALSGMAWTIWMFIPEDDEDTETTT